MLIVCTFVGGVLLGVAGTFAWAMWPEITRNVGAMFQ
jgi:Na+/melibiose symporter-like transporter